MTKGSTHNGRLLARLLLRDVSVFQILIYALGVFLGLFIISVAFQFTLDLDAGRNAEQAEGRSNDYIVLSRHVEGLNFSSSKSDIDNELQLLKGEPWVVKAAPFTAAEFNVTVGIRLGGSSMSSALFFESVPDEFLDEVPEDWTFDPADENAVVPIILPRDYLALYNFGFAASRGLPRIGEEVMKTIPLHISVSGNGKQQYLSGRVVGFTSRLNTIAVPQQFIEWGNAMFGDTRQAQHSRIIAEINVPASDPRVTHFLMEHDLEMGGDKGLLDSSGHILAVMSSVVLVVGLVIAFLSVALLFISIFLLIHKTRPVIYRLLALGYAGAKIAGVYAGLFAAVNLVVLGLALAGLYVVEYHLLNLLHDAGYQSAASTFPTVLLAVAITVFVTLVCYLVFRHATSVKRK